VTLLPSLTWRAWPFFFLRWRSVGYAAAPVASAPASSFMPRVTSSPSTWDADTVFLSEFNYARPHHFAALCRARPARRSVLWRPHHRQRRRRKTTLDGERPSQTRARGVRRPVVWPM